MRARITTDDERVRLWPKAVEVYKPYASYQQKADTTGRTIPVVILQRRPSRHRKITPALDRFERAQFGDEQLRLLVRGEVAALVELVPVPDTNMA